MALESDQAWQSACKIQQKSALGIIQDNRKNLSLRERILLWIEDIFAGCQELETNIHAENDVD